MESGLLLAVLLAAMMVGTVVALVLVSRVLVRSVTTRAHQLRLEADRKVASVRAIATPPGPSREVAQLRHDLLVATDRTTRALAAAARSGRRTGDLPRMFAQLRTQAALVDADLAALCRERDRVRLAAALPSTRQRARAITAAADDVRWAVLDDAAAGDSVDALDLAVRIRDEAVALRAGAEAYRQAGLNRA